MHTILATSTPEVSSQVNAEVTPLPKKKGVSVYVCAIAGGSGTNSTSFQLNFDETTGTYTETMSASDQSSGLDAGTYQKNKNILTTTSKNKTTTEYIMDGKYLLVKNQMYKGKIPSNAGSTFDGTFTYTVKGQSETTVSFTKDGNYTSVTKSIAKESDTSSAGTSENKETKDAGTYEKKGSMIVRTSSQGQPLLDFYIYKNQISNAYYIAQ